VEDLFQKDDSESVPKFAADFGVELYSSGRSKGDFVELVNFLWHKKESWRRRSSQAWFVVSKWGELHPTVHRSPIPLEAVRALVVWALFFDMILFAGAILIGFSGGLRPGELYGLQKQDLKIVGTRESIV
jgi:hypothetical protein